MTTPTKKKAASKKPQVVKTVENPEKVAKKTFLLIVLDRSGSMAGDWPTTLSCLREQILLARNQETEDHKIFAAVSFFNGEVSREPLLPISDLQEFKYLALVPNGGTALYDAMWLGMDALETAMGLAGDCNKAAIMVTITDGEENSSHIIKTPEILKERIQKLTATDLYTFTYAGVEDPLAVSATYGILAGNAIKYSNARDVGTSNTSGLASYYTSRSLGATASANFYAQPADLKNFIVKSTDDKTSP